MVRGSSAERFQMLPPSPFVHAEEPFKGKTAGRHPRDGKGGDYRARPRRNPHRDSPFMAERNQILPGSEMAGIPASDTSAQFSPLSGERRSARPAPLIVLKIADHGLFDVKMIQQSASPGILRRNEIAGFQRFHRTGRQVGQVADRGPDQRQPSHCFHPVVFLFHANPPRFRLFERVIRRFVP